MCIFVMKSQNNINIEKFTLKSKFPCKIRFKRFAHYEVFFFPTKIFFVLIIQSQMSQKGLFVLKSFANIY